MDPPAAVSVIKPSPPCLVVGCGYVGGRLARRLLTSRKVTALVRTADSASALAGVDLEVCRLDLDRLDTASAPLARLSGGATVVYLVPPPDEGTSDTRLARFLTALGNGRPRVLVYVSTTGVYGDTGGETVDEDAPLAAVNERGRRRIDAERTAVAWCATLGVRCVILRAPGIYGPHRLPLDRLRRGEPALREEDASPGNRIHVDDLVAACLAALDRKASGVFNVTDGDHASTTAYLRATAELAGLPPPKLVSRLEAQSQISRGMLAFLGEARRVDNRRMREVLGVQPAYPDMAAGIAASLAEMGITRR